MVFVHLHTFLQAKANLIGVFGVILVLAAYLLLQLHRLSQSSISFSLLNVIGSGCIVISLCFYWNLASVIIEVAWFLISLFGLSRALIKARSNSSCLHQGHTHGNRTEI